jgi:hypothetical protein
MQKVIFAPASLMSGELRQASFATACRTVFGSDSWRLPADILGEQDLDIFPHLCKKLFLT